MSHAAPKLSGSSLVADWRLNILEEVQGPQVVLSRFLLLGRQQQVAFRLIDVAQALQSIDRRLIACAEPVRDKRDVLKADRLGARCRTQLALYASTGRHIKDDLIGTCRLTLAELSQLFLETGLRKQEGCGESVRALFYALTAVVGAAHANHTVAIKKGMRILMR
ncbi:hypothetical protein IC63_09070 [Paracoccus sphaerophysae]|uniref:Uncharacterized protein n=1 Tax=Paracoccus sphaerophysae TaxID=690417 RepID=A0A099F901_9RHOB|nr:hypothetical protein IC63_09070 [Paracoccus sphaerophysae]